jgi:ligand-binding SRPBCC domain-containing protein
MWLPQPLEQVFAFFAEAENLQALTPKWLDFALVTPRPVRMQPGTLIDYRLKLHGLPIRWQSEITAWEPPHRFVDEQRRGPYRLWIHEHRFQTWDSGTHVTDFVRYAVPGGVLVDRLLVRRDIERIFAFRRQKLLEIFGQPR